MQFQTKLLKRVAAGMNTSLDRNYDWLRYGESLKTVLTDRFLTIAARFGWFRCTAAQKAAIMGQLEKVEPHMEGLSWLHDRLADERSRETLLDVIAYRILGYRRVRIGGISESFWQKVPVVLGPAAVSKRVEAAPILDGWLDDYDLSSQGFPVKLRAHRLNVLNSFLLEQYRYHSSDATVQVNAGDVVLDGGGCWGDTALYFATRTGVSGKVHIFEFAPSNLRLLRQNLERNPALAAVCEVHEKALWDAGGTVLHFDEAGPGTSLGKGSMDAHTVSIDEWAETHGKVDFIKLDIEGAEGRALRGAAKTLTGQRPRLAVALYHSLEDFVELPRLIDQMASGYQFFLGHYTIHHEESILFARPA